MFDLAALERAEEALARCTGQEAAAVQPQPGAICPVTGTSDARKAKGGAGRCPVAHGAAHG